MIAGALVLWLYILMEDMELVHLQLLGYIHLLVVVPCAKRALCTSSVYGI